MLIKCHICCIITTTIPPASKAKELTPGRLLNNGALPLIEQKGANYYEHKQRAE